MSNLATITNNILADSGIDDINVIVSTGSYANPAWITSLAWTKITGAPTFVTGTGTNNRIAKFTSTGTTIGNSNISDDGGSVTVVGGTAMSGGWNRNTILEATYPVLVFNGNNTKWAAIGYDWSVGYRLWANKTSSDVTTGSTVMFIANSGYVEIYNYLTSTSYLQSTSFASFDGSIQISSASSQTMIPYIGGVSESAEIGLYYNAIRATNQASLTGYTIAAHLFRTEFTATSGTLLRVNNLNSTKFTIDFAGNVSAAGLVGTGTRMVVTDAGGNLSAQAIPTSGVTGSGTNDYLTKWSGGGTSITNSTLYDNGQRIDFIGVGTSINGGWTVNQMNRSIYPVIAFNSTASPNRYAGIGYEASATSGMHFWVNSSDLNGITVSTNRGLVLWNDRSVEVFGPLRISRSPMTSQASYTYQNIVVSAGFGGGYADARIQSLLAGYDGVIYGTDIGYSYDGGGAGNVGYSLRFSTNDDLSGNPIERLRINSQGIATFSSTSSGGQNIRLQTSVATGRNYVQWANPSGDMGYIGYGGADSTFFINNQLNSDMLFYTNSTLRLTISSGGTATFVGALLAGNVSATRNTIGTLDIGISGGGYATAGYNINYTSTANIYTYKVLDVSWMIDYGNANAFRVRYGSGGAAGVTISYANYLTIATSGAATFASTVTTGDAFFVGASGGGGGIWTWNSTEAFIYSPTGKSFYISSGATATNGLHIATNGDVTINYDRATIEYVTMTGGWNRVLTLKGTYPVISLHSTHANKYGFIGYDSSGSGNLVFWGGGTGNNVGTAQVLANVENNGQWNFPSSSSQWKINISETTNKGGENGIAIRSGYYPALKFQNYNGLATTAKIVINTFATGYGSASLAGSFLLQSDNALQFSTGGDFIRMTIASNGSTTFLGSVTATAFFESSDSRIKTLLEDKLDYQAIAKVTAKYYEKNGKIELGYFAQDFETLLPSAVSKNEDGYLNLSYREVHTAKIAYLEKRIKQLEEKYENN